ncbi:MAG: IclR family transcriptional regulator [Kiloniellales bacterium]|nr:IclR family transcriptional regulator [Kiloniellales bacterium]
MTKEAPSRPRGRPRGSEPAGSVQALDRALSLLELLADADGLTLTELAQKAEMAPSTAHRLLTTLEGRGFADHDREQGSWRIGVGAFRVGSAFLRNRKVVTMGRAVMRSLMEDTEETVNLGIADGAEVVFISQFESHSPMRAFFRPGRRGPIHASGLGKAILASCPDEEVRALFRDRELARFTGSTITSLQGFLEELAAIRQRGWSLDDQEHTLGMRCIAAAIHDEYGEPIAGVSVSGPSVRIPDDRLDALGRAVVAAAAEITESIGGRAPERS